MPDTAPAPNALADAVVATGIDLVACLPDSWLRPALDVLDAHPDVEVVRVAREDDGLGICAGAWLGGRRAVLLCQNAGLLLSTNALAGLAHHHQTPVVVVAAARGGLEDGFYYQAYKGRVTGGVLDAIGVPHHQVRADEGFGILDAAYRQAELHRRPVVVLAEQAALAAPGAPR